MNSNRTFTIVALLGLIAYSLILQRNMVRAVSAADPSGYMNEALLFSKGRMRAPIEPLRQLGLPSSFGRLFIPIGWGSALDQRYMVPTYPAGTPLHFIAAAWIAGWDIGPYYVSPLAALASIVLLFFMGRDHGLSQWWSAAAAAIFGGVPVIIHNALQPLSDSLATLWAIAAMWCAFRARAHPGFAFAAGAALAIGVWVRPTNLLIGFPLLFAMRLHPRLIGRAIVAAIPFGLALMWLNWKQFGSPLKTGYGTLGEMLVVSALIRCPAHHSLWLLRMLSPLLPLAALIALFLRRIESWTRATLAVWFGVFFVFYAAYPNCSDWSDLRFIMPAVPPIVLAGVLTLSHWRAPKLVPVAIILAVLVVEARVTKQLGILGHAHEYQVWPDTVRWAERHVPRDAMLISGIFGGTQYYYAQRPTVRWELMTTDDYQLLRAHAANAGLPWYALTSAGVDVTPEEFVKKFPGKWTVLGTSGDITLWRLDE